MSDYSTSTQYWLAGEALFRITRAGGEVWAAKWNGAWTRDVPEAVVAQVEAEGKKMTLDEANKFFVAAKKAQNR